MQCGLWVFCSLETGGEGTQLGRELSGCFLAFVSAAAAFAFLLYGGRLWLMLRRFPIESRGRWVARLAGRAGHAGRQLLLCGQGGRRQTARLAEVTVWV